MTDVMLIFEIGKGEILGRIKEIEVSYKDQRFFVRTKLWNQQNIGGFI